MYLTKNTIIFSLEKKENIWGGHFKAVKYSYKFTKNTDFPLFRFNVSLSHIAE